MSSERWRLSSRWLAPLAFAGLVSSCGDPLVNSDYAGEPLLDIEGPLVIEGVGELNGAQGTVRLAVFWAKQGGFEPGAGHTDFAEQSVSLSDLPGTYAARIYVPPSPESMLELEGAKVGLGSLVVYIDLEDNGHFDPGVDAPVGASRDHLLLYVDGETEVPSLGTLPRGYHPLAIERGPPKAQTQCGDPVPDFVSYTLADDPIAVVVTLLHTALVDIDCDLSGAEYDVCPPPPNIVEICDGMWDELERCLPWTHCF